MAIDPNIFQEIPENGDEYGDSNISGAWVEGTSATVGGTGFLAGIGTAMKSIFKNAYEYGTEGAELLLQKVLSIGSTANSAVQVLNTTQDIIKSITSTDDSIDITDNGDSIDFKAPTPTTTFARLDVTDTTYNSIEIAGGIRSNGGNWDDINMDVTSLTGRGTNPSNRTFTGNIQIAGFRGDGTDEVSTTMELPHERKALTPVKFHAHCYVEDTTVGNVYLTLEYVFTYEGEAIGTPTTIQVIGTTPGVAYERFTLDFPDITVPTDVNGDDFAPQFHFRFARLGGDTLDTYDDWVLISTIGAHINVDSFGSDGVVTKS